MALALRNKQIFALIAMVALTLQVIAFVVLSAAQNNSLQAINFKPLILMSW